MKGSPRKRELSWRRRRGWAALVVVGGFTLLVLMTALFGEQGLLKVRHMEGERAVLEENIASLEGETAELRGQIRSLQTEPFAYEQLARERLGLVRPGEVVYDFRADPLASAR